ncbi:hypothetical protein C8D87_103539 [Lentzea atacamensis]|uniref:Excreted virulence factor EspC, type VII ESX diderm n=2 Tax=Lentzea atacamensis TaxID=531938 RepID=A0ABX9EDR4_9PSEU|nr:hypothetical protein C8D87_103539 [Lentzea atacamensis]
MGEKFHVVPNELRGCSGLLERQAEHFLTIREHAIVKGGDTSGFTGLLSLLDPVVTGVAQLYGETLDAANQKMSQDGHTERMRADFPQRQSSPWCVRESNSKETTLEEARFVACSDDGCVGRCRSADRCSACRGRRTTHPAVRRR